MSGTTTSQSVEHSGEHSMRSDALSRQTEQLRRLARGLLFDASGADDVVQEAWLTALRRHRDAADAPVGWMHGVVRNLTRQSHRGAVRRAQHEGRSDPAEPSPSAHSAAARLEVTRRLLNGVEQLPEPYRTAIVLRYFDDLKPRQIASRLSLPVNTVRTHLRRGLERLRADLDPGSETSLGSFAIALSPLAAPSPWLGVTSTSQILGFAGAFTMSAKSLVGLAAIALFALFLWQSDEASGPSTSTLDVDPQVAIAAPTIRSLEDPDRDALAILPARADVSDAPLLHIVGEVLQQWTPVKSVPIEISIYGSTATDGPPVAKTTLLSDEAGDFEWPISAPTRPIFVVARATGERWSSQPTSLVVPTGELTPSRLRVIVTEHDCEARGRVVDTNGAPVAGTSLAVRGYQATSDDDGAFVIRLPSGSDTERISAKAEGYGLGATQLRVEPGRASITGIEIVLTREFRVRGRVTDQDHQPIVGARVASLLSSHIATETDDRGEYNLGGLDPSERTHLLVATAPNHARLQQQITVMPPGERWDAKSDLLLIVNRGDLHPGAAPLKLDFVLKRGAEIKGEVVDPDGNPIAGVETYRGMNFDLAMSDVDGQFIYRGLEAGTDRLVFRHDDWNAPGQDVELVAGKSTSIRVVMESGHFLEGVVTELGEEAIPRAIVSLEIDGERIPVRTFTDATGRFSMRGLPASGVMLHAWAPAYQSLDRAIEAVDRTDVVLQLVPSGRIRGMVVDLAGRPIPSFKVRLTHARVTEGETAARPTYEWTEEGVLFQNEQGTWDTGETTLTPGTFVDVEVEVPNQAISRVEHYRIPPGPDPVALVSRVGAASTVRGVVTIAGSTVAAGVDVELFEASQLRARNTQIDPLDKTTTDDAGNFELSAPATRVLLSVRLTDDETFLDGPFDVAANRVVTRNIDVGGGEIYGVVVDSQGHPIAGDLVVATLRGGAGKRSTSKEIETDANGQFRFKQLQVGDWRVSHLVRDDDGNIARGIARQVTIVASEVVEVDLRPTGSARLNVTIDGPAEMQASAEVTLSKTTADGSPPEFFMARAQSDGTLEFDGLTIGEYEVTARANATDGGAKWQGTATVSMNHAELRTLKITMSRNE